MTTTATAPRISADDLDATFAALAEPHDMSQPAISKHLKVLERAGLISIGMDAQRRPRRLEAKPLAEATGWLEHYRQFWEGSYARLDVLLEELQAGITAAQPQKPRKKRNPAKRKGTRR